MANWSAKYRNDYGEYEITFASKELEKTKAVEKVCCAIMDRIVNTKDDVQIVRHGRWLNKKMNNYDVECYTATCSVCNRRVRFFVEDHCPNCGAKMDLEG